MNELRLRIKLEGKAAKAGGGEDDLAHLSLKEDEESGMMR